MIEIRIADTATVEPKHLAAIARALLEIAGEPQAIVVRKSAESREMTVAAREYAEVPDAVKMGVIAPEDVPSVGEPTAREVFGEPTAAAVFGGNVQAGAALSTLQDGTPPAPNNGAQTVGASTPANGVDVDADGLPWNGTIHASTKAKLTDGRWKKRRGVDESLVARTEAELRAVMAIPTPPAGNATGASNIDVAAPAAIPTPPAPPIVPPAPDTIPSPPAGVAPKITGFAQLLPAVTNGIAAGTLTEAQVQAALQKAGVAVLPMLAPRPDLVAVVAAELFPEQ